MKSRVLLTLAALFLVGTLAAQVRFGVEAGANWSKFVGNGTSPSDKGGLKTGFQLGVTADYEFKNHLMLMSGLSFIRRSGDLKLGTNYAGGTSFMAYPKVETRINYLQLPVALGYHWRMAENFSLIPFVGAYAAYGLGAGRCDLDVAKEDASRVESVGWKPLQGAQAHGLDAFRRWDWGGTAGLKAVIGNHYMLAFRYSVGIMKAQTQYGLRNSTYQLSVGYRF